MGVSRAWFGAWVVDSAWVGQRARICAMWPALAELFESCAGREIASVHSKPLKRRRKRGGGKRIVIPQRGIWYTFKEWLSRWTHAQLRDIRHTPGLGPLRTAMLATHLVLCCGWSVTGATEEHIEGNADDVVRVRINFKDQPVTMQFDVGTCWHIIHVHVMERDTDRVALFVSEMYERCAIVEPWRNWVRDAPHRASDWARLRPLFTAK